MTVGHNSGGALDLMIEQVIADRDYDQIALLRGKLLDPELIRAEIKKRHTQPLDRARDLFAAVKVMKRELGETGITTDAQAATATDFVGQLKRSAKAIEEIRTNEKRPFAEAVSAVDGYLKTNVSDVMTVTAGELEKSYLTPYGLRKADDERARAQAEAARLREAQGREAEAARLADAAAARTLNPDIIDTAAQHAATADNIGAHARIAENRATASVTELGRLRGDHGAVGVMKGKWTYEVADIAKVPKEYLLVNDRLVRAAIAGPQGKRDIPGLRIFQEHDVKVRA